MNEKPTGELPRNTLGFHRKMAAIVFGEESPAVAYLDEKIKDDPSGMYGEIIVDEGQLVLLLFALDKTGGAKK